MQDFASYGWALAAVALYGVMAQVLNAATGIRKGKLKMVPGAHHEPDFNNPAYRLDRAYMNSIETIACQSPCHQKSKIRSLDKIQVFPCSEFESSLKDFGTCVSGEL